MNLCNSTRIRLCSLENCDICYNKSCASDNSIINWSKNNILNPRLVMKGSDKICLWDCNECGHKDYDMSAYKKCKKNWGCPYCSSRRLHTENCDICYNKSFANNPKAIYWNYELNGWNIMPWYLFPCDLNKYWFDCEDCGHHIYMAPVNITANNNWCSYCAHLLLCNNDNCYECFEKSFASHPKAIYWNYELNKGILPRTVFKGSGTKKYWFTCKDCNHDFDMIPGSVSGSKPQWCSYCAKPPQRKCDDINCEKCSNKTFASSHRAKFWNYELNGDITPRDIFLQTSQEFWFNCDKCPHKFKKKIHLIHTENSWCQYCSHDLLCDNEECEMCLNNSFASHPRSNEWNKHKNLGILPRNIFKSTNKNYWFDCDICNKSFKTSVDKITCANQGCPKCKNKTEQIVYTFLKTFYQTIQHGFSVNWCKNIRNLPFDIVIDNLKLIIEIDGPQHIDKNIWNWSTPEENQKNDIFKMKCANENGYSVIRILQEDVWFSKYDWKTELLNVIKEYSTPINIFLCKNNEYINHIS